MLGDVFIGVDNGNFGTIPPGWHDHGSISAIDVANGRRVWKFDTPEPERGGVTTTASGLGFAGGGDGVVRAFDVHNGNVLWTCRLARRSPRGRPFSARAAASTSRSRSAARRRPRTAASSPSSGSTRSAGPAARPPRRRTARAIVAAAAPSHDGSRRARAPARRRDRRRRGGRRRGSTTQAPLDAAAVERDSRTRRSSAATSSWRGTPVSGAAIARRRLPAAGPHRRQRPLPLPDRSDARPRATRSHVVDLAGAKVGGKALAAPEKSAAAWAPPTASASATSIADLRVRPQQQRASWSPAARSTPRTAPRRRWCCTPTSSPARSPTPRASPSSAPRVVTAPRTATSGRSRCPPTRTATTCRSSRPPTRWAPTRCR